jgi:hypothetical protein
MDIFTIMIALWTLLTLMWVVGGCAVVWFGIRWRTAKAKTLYLGQCDVALQYPQFSNPEDKLDMRAHTVAGDKTAFEQYEWYVARLVYVLDECLKLGPRARWRTVADTQLSNHKHYFGSDYYKKQDYLPHYSRRMRALIGKQMAKPSGSAA